MSITRSGSAHSGPAGLPAIGARTLLQVVIVAVLLIAAFRQPLSSVLYRWQHDGNWSHGWLVPLFSLYFLYANRARLAAVQRRTNYLGMLVVIVSLGAMLASYQFSFNYPRALLLVLTAYGLTLFLGGWQVLKATWFPIGFLVLAIPLPEDLYVALTMPLRKLASLVAAQLLAVIPNVHTEVSGVVIDFSYQGRRGSLNVEEACSGMRLMMAFVTLGVAMAYLGERPAWQRIVMVLFCVPIAVFCNMIRVTTTGALYVFIADEELKRKLTSGTPHALLGLAMLPIALGLFALIGWILSNLFVDEPPEVAGEGVDQP